MSYSKKNDRNRKKRKNSDSNEVLCSSSPNSNDVSTSQKYSEVSLDLGIAKRTRSKMRSIKEESEVGNVSLGLSTDFEVESSDNDIELVSLHVEAGKVREQNEETNTTLHYDADAEEGLKVRNTQNGYDHSADDSKESAELNGSNLHACAETADMANESMPTGANEAAILSQSNDGHFHSDDGHKERNEAAETSDSHLYAENKLTRMASEEKVPTGPNQDVPPSYSKRADSDSHDSAEAEATDMAGCQ